MLLCAGPHNEDYTFSASMLGPLLRVFMETPKSWMANFEANLKNGPVVAAIRWFREPKSWRFSPARSRLQGLSAKAAALGMGGIQKRIRAVHDMAGIGSGDSG